MSTAIAATRAAETSVRREHAVIRDHHRDHARAEKHAEVVAQQERDGDRGRHQHSARACPASRNTSSAAAKPSAGASSFG